MNQQLKDLFLLKGKELEIAKQVKDAFPNFWENTAVGNDSALWRSCDCRYNLISKDLFIQGVHFFKKTPWYTVAYKALTVAVSDILADGGTPKAFMIGLGLDNDAKNSVSIITNALIHAAQHLQIPIIGGDTSFSSQFFLSVTCLGYSYDSIWLKKNAKDGNYIYVTGVLGQSSYGLELLKQTDNQFNLTNPYIYRHLYPPYYGFFVKYLQQKYSDSILAATDISDSFITDLYEILIESSKGAVILENKIPLDPIISNLQEDEFKLTTQEDYELILITKKPLNEDEILKDTQVLITHIGYIQNDLVCSLQTKDYKKNVDISKMKNQLFYHFK